MKKYTYINNGEIIESLNIPTGFSYTESDYVVEDHSLKVPRIQAFQIDKSKHFHAVDFHTELTVTLKVDINYSRNVSDRGLLVSKVYSHNSVNILKINYINTLNFSKTIIGQNVIIEYYNEDGTVNDNIKDKGYVSFSSIESKQATYKRREAIIGILENDIEMMVTSSGTDEQKYANLLGARNLLTTLSPEVTIFKNTSNPTPLIQKIEDLTPFIPLLQSPVAPNITASQYIINFLTY